MFSVLCNNRHCEVHAVWNREAYAELKLLKIYFSFITRVSSAVLPGTANFLFRAGQQSMDLNILEQGHF